MDSLLVHCDGGSCCCLPQRSAVVLISIISLIASTLDSLSNASVLSTCYYIQGAYWDVIERVHSLKIAMITMFQVANLLLLVASVFESSILVQLYVWCTLAFLVMGFIISIVEFVFKFQTASFVDFIVEVAFFFAIGRCLIVVDSYRRLLIEKL